MAKCGPEPRPPAERMWAKVDRRGPDECWPYGGRVTDAGYGVVWIPGDTQLRAHRLAYESANGPIPPGMDIDHVCHNADQGCAGGPCGHRRCCNPAHLEATTRRVNTMRGKTLAASKAAQTHCVNGHELEGDNVYRHPQRGTRMCRTCMVEASRRRRSAGAGPCSAEGCASGAYARGMCQAHYMHWYRTQG